MSKFEHGCFCGGYDDFAVSKERYTKEQAISIAIENLDPYPSGAEEWILCVGDCWVRHRAGVNEDGEPQVGWWMEYKEHNRSCPAWCFHVGRKNQRNGLSHGYEQLRVARGTVQAALPEDAHD